MCFGNGVFVVDELIFIDLCHCMKLTIVCCLISHDIMACGTVTKNQIPFIESRKYNFQKSIACQNLKLYYNKKYGVIKKENKESRYVIITREKWTVNIITVVTDTKSSEISPTLFSPLLLTKPIRLFTFIYLTRNLIVIGLGYIGGVVNFA